MANIFNNILFFFYTLPVLKISARQKLTKNYSTHGLFFHLKKHSFYFRNSTLLHQQKSPVRVLQSAISTLHSQLVPTITRTDNYNVEGENRLGHYLAGLIEGDGYINITNQNRVILGITFNLKDKPSPENLLNFIGSGSIVRRKTNSVELRFSAFSSLIKIVKLVNGKFRTPKVDQLYKLID